MEGFPECKGISPDNRLKVVLDAIFNQTGNGFIFIIDEWDCVFRIAKEREDIQKNYLDFLRGLFKGSDYVELAYMTGILPVKKYGDHSAINIFREFSMLSPKGLAEYFGFPSALLPLADYRYADFQACNHHTISASQHNLYDTLRRATLPLLL